jgi:hypothetical protein
MKKIIILDSSTSKVYVACVYGTDVEAGFNQWCEEHKVRPKDCDWMKFEGIIQFLP